MSSTFEEAQMGDRVVFRHTSDEDGVVELAGHVNGPVMEDYVPVWVYALSNTIFVHRDNVASIAQED